MSPAGRQRLAAFVLGALSLTAPSCNRDSAQRSASDRETLANILGSRRIVEPRLTGGSRYVPLDEVSALPTPGLPAEEQRELLRAADSISRDDRPLDPEARHTAGLLDLALGKIDSSVAHLRQAAAEAPRNAGYLADLTAAYLVRAAEQDRPIDLAAALDAAERAVTMSPENLEALFNRALARQRLSLTGEAVKGWQEYLEHETDQGWIREAELAIEKLQAPTAAELWESAKPRLREAVRKGDQKTVTHLVDSFRQEAREQGENENLTAWADLSQRGDSAGAAAELAVARAIGRALARLSGESMLADTVAGIDRAHESDPERLQALADGILTYRQGLLLLKDRKFFKAAALLERAERVLRRVASPFAAWVDFALVRCAYQREHYTEVQRRALRLLGRLDTARYPVLAGRARWVLGTAQMAIARPAEALASYQLAFGEFERTREAKNKGSVHSLLASAFNQLGDAQSAWQHRARALPVLSRYQDQALRPALINVALGALDAGYRHAALTVQSEAVQLARRQDDSEQIANSLINRASILARTGLADPEIDLSEARTHCDLIQDPSIRQSILADLLAVEGYVFQGKEPARALPALDQALEMYSASDRRIMLPPALHARAATFRALGRDAEAEQDLRTAVEELERVRGSVADAEQRAGILGRMSTGAIFDSMVLLQVEHGRNDLALEYSERRRARLLLDWLSAVPEEIDTRSFRLETWSRPRPLQELQQSIPDGVAVIVSELLPDRLLLWVVRRDVLDLRQVKIPASRAEALVRRFKAATNGPERTLRPASAKVYELLVAPVAKLVEAGETLVFVPESPLDSIPFGLLFDARRGRYLIEDRPFAVSPSLSLFTGLTQKARPQSFANADVLAIANPAFDRSRYPKLESLPGTLEEARAIQGLFAEANVVPGQEAGRQVLLEGMGRYRILHFGGHTLVNAAKPLLSSLLLAPGREPGDSGLLYAREIVGPPDGDTDLVVLSSCRSAGGAELPAEGVAGLVWPFFSRGASMVIASTREVRDSEAARLFTFFYRHLAAGVSPGSALRKAQLEMLAANRSTGRRSFDWAVFQLYGAAPGTDTREKGEKP